MVLDDLVVDKSSCLTFPTESSFFFFIKFYFLTYKMGAKFQFRMHQDVKNKLLGNEHFTRQLPTLQLKLKFLA